MWDAETFDHRLTIQAHAASIVAITSCFASPSSNAAASLTQVSRNLKFPVGNSLAAIAALSAGRYSASRGTVIFTAANDGTIKVGSVDRLVIDRSIELNRIEFIGFGLDGIGWVGWVH